MAITKREKRDLHILMHQLRVRVDNLTKGKEVNHSASLASIHYATQQLDKVVDNISFANDMRKLKRKNRR